MESEFQTSSGPIWTLSHGFAGAAGCGAGWAGVGTLFMRCLLKAGGRTPDGERAIGGESPEAAGTMNAVPVAVCCPVQLRTAK